MSPNDTITGWHATDDDAVPIRSSVAATTHVQAPKEIGQTDHIVLHHAPATYNTTSMRLAALFGVTIVLSAIGMTFGFGSLFGELLDHQDARTTVEITTSGTFSPDIITLHPGDTFILRNTHADPQVIKSHDERSLFPTQVLFEEDFTFTVPTDATGTYTYFSETLPDDRLLTIIIAGATQKSETFSEIPLSEYEHMQVSSASSSVPTVSVESTEHTNETAVISLSGTATTSSSQASVSASADIPVNPYTASHGYAQNNSTAIANAAFAEKNLHSGAPLKQLSQHTPSTITQTGPAGIFLFMLPALFGVMILYRKHTAVS